MFLGIIGTTIFICGFALMLFTTADIFNYHLTENKPTRREIRLKDKAHSYYKYLLKYINYF